MPLVKLYANLRKIAGTKELPVTGSTVGSALRELVRLHPALDAVLLEGEGLRPHVVVTLNGYNVTDLATQVTEQDVIAVFPPIAGGCFDSFGFGDSQRPDCFSTQRWF